MHLRFDPDAGRTALVDRAIRQALAESVTRVLTAAAGAGIGWSGQVEAWCARLLAMPAAPPQLWAGYHDLVQAIVRADEPAIGALASELLARLPCPPAAPGRVVTLAAADLGPIDAARYRAIIDGDPGNPLGLVPASRAEVTRVAALVAQARGLLAAVDGELLDEVDTLGHQIVLATGEGPSGFGGAASVFLWGAVILNPDLLPDRVTLVEGLAHETAHALLFGLTLGADLTTNDPAARYASPLRRDPRPMEGIVHATFVLARMNYALARLRHAPRLERAEHDLLATKMARNRALYAAGLTVVDAHARFTPEGAAIFGGCRRAMAADA